MNIESRPSDVAKQWIDEEERALLGHPESAIWSRYNTGELPAAEIERLRDHLVACRACRAVLLASPQAGTTIVPEPEASLAEAEESRAWHRLQRRIDLDGVPADLPPWVPATRSWTTWVPTVVAVLALFGMGWFWRQANRPVLGLVNAEEAPVAAERSGPPGGIAEKEGRPLALLLSAPGLTAGGRVRVEILDGQGAIEWTGESPALADDEYGVQLPARFRRIVGCRVRLSVPAEGDAAHGWKVLGTYVVTAPAAP